jgi:uncharacterized protein (DUF2141 family)
MRPFARYLLLLQLLQSAVAAAAAAAAAAALTVYSRGLLQHDSSRHWCTDELHRIDDFCVRISSHMPLWVHQQIRT